MSSPNDCILFEHIVKLLNSISKIPPTRSHIPRNTTKNHRSLDLVKQWLTRLREYYTVVPPHTCKIFFRFLFPEEDSRRRYNLKETTLARTLAVDVFGLSILPEGSGRAFLEWSEYPSAVDKAKLGCLGIEVERALADRQSTRQSASPSIQRIDMLLDELASLCGYSNLECLQPRPHRSRAAILRDMYLGLDPVEAKFLTQIILKDLRPVLYPLAETHTTRALLHYKSNAVHVLTKWEVMNAWHYRMPRIYLTRATLDEAARVVDMLSPLQQIPPDHEAFLPVLGIPVEIPKSEKGVKLTHALSFFRDDEVWCETKYDGERMQIHVDLSRPPSQQITIFSKSKRNSTKDRMGTHPIIRALLGLEPLLGDYLQYPVLQERASGLPTTVTSSVILDAEMVAYSESKGDIDEFWRIRSLIESTAHGVRGARRSRNQQAHVNAHESQDTSGESDREESQEPIMESLQSNASDNGDRHLKIVLFDIMLLDGRSLLNATYSERRAQLERTINIIPGYVSLSRRQRISLACGIPTAVRDLARIFSEHVANHQEGLVLKASTSTYNSLSHPWVKLKRDYIPGYGDTVDLVILGANWNKTRARELRVAPETFTTFFVAAPDKPCPAGDLTHHLPQFHVIFTVEFGLDRDQLETLNLYIKTSEPQRFSDEMPCLPYNFRLPKRFAKPTVMFSRPLLGELYGAGFSKDPGAQYYSLRFPRLTKVWRSNERDWTTGVCLEDFQKLARTSIGRESSDEWASRNVASMWGCDVNPGPKDPQRVAETTRQWCDQFLKLEGITLGNADGAPGSNSKSEYCVSLKTKHKAAPKGIQESTPKRRKLNPTPTRMAPQPLRALAFMTNLMENNTNVTTKTQSAVQPATPRILSIKQDSGKASKLVGNTRMITNLTPVSLDQIYPTEREFTIHSITAPKMPFNISINGMRSQSSGTSSRRTQSSYLAQPSSPPNSQSLDMLIAATTNITTNGCFLETSEQLPGSCWPQHYAHTPIVRFIQDAYIWIHRDSDNRRPTNRPPALHLMPQNRRIGVMYILLVICGCHVEVDGELYFKKPEQFALVNKCVVFVKTGDQPDVKAGLAWLFQALESWRSELNKLRNKELFVFDSEMITYTSLATFRGDVSSQALWRSSQPPQ